MVKVEIVSQQPTRAVGSSGRGSTAFFAFGLTDFRDAYALKSWLIWLKAANLLALLWLRSLVISRYCRESKSKPGFVFGFSAHCPLFGLSMRNSSMILPSSVHAR